MSLMLVEFSRKETNEIVHALAGVATFSSNSIIY